jgi:hypothetical protein
MAKRRKKKGGTATPQPPAPAPGPAPAVPGYGLEYNPTIESQLNQPYQDIIAAQATSVLPNIAQNWQGLQDYANFYGGAGAEMFGGFMAGTPAERALTGQFGGQAGGTLGQYGQLLDPNLAIQQGLAQEIQDIQAGRADFDPFLTQQFNDQERVLREHLRRQLGPDYEGSSAGIEALGKFNQNKTTTLGSAQFQRLNELVGMQQQGIGNLANQAGGFANIYGVQRGQQFNQADVIGQRYGQYAQDLYNQAMGLRSAQLGGAGAMLNQAGAMQNLYANVPRTMGQFGQAMGQQAGMAVGAQEPYLKERELQLGASYAPTSGEKMGQYMGQSGSRWASIGSSMMGGGMGGGGG